METLWVDLLRADATVDSIVECAVGISSDIPMNPERGILFSKESVGGATEKAVNIGCRHSDVFEVRATLYEECLGYRAMDPVEGVVLTLATLQASRGNPKKSIIGEANISRDSDTISRLGGSICGASKGIDAIPKKRLEEIEKAIKAEIAGKRYRQAIVSNSRRFGQSGEGTFKRLENNAAEIGRLL